MLNYLFFTLSLVLAQQQVRLVTEDISLWIYAEPRFSAEKIRRFRYDEVIYIYESDEKAWLATEEGWLPRSRHLQFEPAQVRYTATLAQDEIEVRHGNHSQTLHKDDLIGVVALQFDQAYLYSTKGAGWANLAEINVDDPHPDLGDLVEQRAYIQVLEADFYPEAEATEMLFQKPLGEKITVFYQEQGWALVGTNDQRLGWTRSENLDILPLVQGRGFLNVGPVNLRESPPDGSVLTVLDYQAQVLVIGKNAAGDWLYLGIAGEGDGIRGWVLAEFVDHELENLPICQAEGQCDF